MELWHATEGEVLEAAPDRRKEVKDEKQRKTKIKTIRLRFLYNHTETYPE